MQDNFGPVALLGSGETSLAGGRIFESIAGKFYPPLRIAIMETPAGFELNSPKVAGRVADFLNTRLQNFNPQIDVIPARKRGTLFDPDDSQILQPLLQANIIFMGAGSPTYAVNQLKGSLAWELVRARQRKGAALIFASAAVIAVGAWSLPVYEIYKVGQDVHALPGLDFFADFNLFLSIIPHWNNTDGGDDVDTSRCFIGSERFNQWCNLLPSDQSIIGLDEHTGIIIDFQQGKCNISGVSSVTLQRKCNPEIFPSGAEFPIAELGLFRKPENPETGISTLAWNMLEKSARFEGPDEAPAEVVRLADERQKARLREDWPAADVLRKKITERGWTILDTVDGQKIVRQS